MKRNTKVILIAALLVMVSMLFVACGSSSSEKKEVDENMPFESATGIVFDSNQAPGYSTTIAGIVPDVLPNGEGGTAAISIAVELYNQANKNMLNTENWAYMVSCKSDMSVDIGLAKMGIPVRGNRFVLKNGTKYYYTEYSVPGKGGLGAIAGMFEKENTSFSIRSYVDVSKMDYMYSEKSYDPQIVKDEETGASVVVPDWGNRVSETKWKSEREIPVYHASQGKTYAQTSQIIKKETVSKATIEKKTCEGGKYYSVTMELDLTNPETTSISLIELRQGAGENANYKKMTVTMEVWENGYFKRFRSVDEWEAGMISSVLDYDTFFYYDGSYLQPSHYTDFIAVKKAAGMGDENDDEEPELPAVPEQTGYKKGTLSPTYGLIIAIVVIVVVILIVSLITVSSINKKWYGKRRRRR